MYYGIIFYMNNWVWLQSNLGSNCGSPNLLHSSSFISKFGFSTIFGARQVYMWWCSIMKHLFQCTQSSNLLFTFFMNIWHNMIILRNYFVISLPRLLILIHKITHRSSLDVTKTNKTITRLDVVSKINASLNDGKNSHKLFKMAV